MLISLASYYEEIRGFMNHLTLISREFRFCLRGPNLHVGVIEYREICVWISL